MGLRKKVGGILDNVYQLLFMLAAALMERNLLPDFVIRCSSSTRLQTIALSLLFCGITHCGSPTMMLAADQSEHSTATTSRLVCTGRAFGCCYQSGFSRCGAGQ